MSPRRYCTHNTAFRHLQPVVRHALPSSCPRCVRNLAAHHRIMTESSPSAVLSLLRPRDRHAYYEGTTRRRIRSPRTALVTPTLGPMAAGEHMYQEATAAP